MTDKKFDVEDAIGELGVLLSDSFNGLLITTLKKNFFEEYKDFDTMTAWECFVDEVNRVNTVCELHDYLVNDLEELKELKRMTTKRFKMNVIEEELYPMPVYYDNHKKKELKYDEVCDLLNGLHDEKQSVIDWIDKKIDEIKPYNSELCRATLLELKEFLE